MRPSRIKGFVVDHQDTVVGILIVMVTVFGAYVTWRAASASATGSDLDQRSRQERILSQLEDEQNERLVSYERNLFSSFRAHLAEADSLAANAERLGDTSALGQTLRYREAQERAAARSLELLFSLQLPVFEGQLTAYDTDFSEREQNAGETVAYQPATLEAAADDARTKRYILVIIDTVAVAAIFFLSLSLLGPDAVGRRKVRPRFAWFGFALALVALTAFGLQEILVTVSRA